MGCAHSAPQGRLAGAAESAARRSGAASVRGRCRSRCHLSPRDFGQDYGLLQRVLGRDAWDRAYVAARRKSDGSEFAARAVPLAGLGTRERKRLEQEVEVCLSVDHPHLAQLMDAYEADGELYLVSEWPAGGDLQNRLDVKGRFGEREAQDAVWQMLLAISYLHDRRVAHGGVGLQHFVFEAQGGRHLKLVDFSRSRFVAGADGLAADMWGVGESAYQLLFGCAPFAGDAANRSAEVKAGRLSHGPEEWARLSPSAQDFLSRLLVAPPRARMTARQALEHPWIAERDQAARAACRVGPDAVSAVCKFGQASAFRRACLSVLAWSLVGEDTAQARLAFLELDASRKGEVSPGDFQRVVQGKFHVEDRAAAMALEALAGGRGGRIRYSDFLAAMVASPAVRLSEGLLKCAFGRLDLQGSGSITAADLQEVLGVLDFAEVAQMMAEAEPKVPDEISYQEFCCYVRRPEMGRRRNCPQEASLGLVL